MAADTRAGVDHETEVHSLAGGRASFSTGRPRAAPICRPDHRSLRLRNVAVAARRARL
jgi:hypothetical protein